MDVTETCNSEIEQKFCLISGKISMSEMQCNFLKELFTFFIANGKFGTDFATVWEWQRQTKILL